MKQGWKKMLTVALVLMLAMAVLPLTSVLAESASTKYGKVTTNQVFLRKQPSTGADYWFRMDKDHVGKILGEVTQNGTDWYKVETGHPDDNGRTYTGYIMKSFFTPLTAAETESWLAGKGLGGSSTSGSAGTGGNTNVSKVQGEITAGGTNFRYGPSTKDQKIMSLERGTIVEITSIPETVDTAHWYGVYYAGYHGYIMSTYVRLLSTPSGDSSGSVTIHGYVKLTRSSANLRSAPNGAIVVSDGWKGKGDIQPYVSKPVFAGGYTWYELIFSGIHYWVRSDCVQTVDSTGQVVTPPATDTSSPTSAPSTPSSGYVITTQGGVNLRLQPFGAEIVQIKRGVTLPYEHVIEPYTANNNSQYRWFYVVYEGLHGYVRSDCVEVVTVSNTPTSTPGVTPAPGPSTSYSYVKMVKTGVNLRPTPGGKSLEQIALGTVVPVIGPVLDASNYRWYLVQSPSGKTGYVRGDCVTPCDANGNVGGSVGSGTVTPAPTPTDGIYGYVQIILDRTNIRQSINGKVIIQLPKKGGIYPLRGQAQHKNNEVWYPIIYEGMEAWVRGDCVILVNSDGTTATPSATATPTPAPTTTPGTGPSTYVITVLNDVNIRVSASKDSNSLGKVPLGTVLAYNSTTGSGSNLWYRVVYGNRLAWVLGSCVRIMTQAEYDAWLQQNPGTEPPTEVILGYVKTITDKVNIREKTSVNSNKVDQIAKSGTVLPYSDTAIVGTKIWYYVQTSAGLRGWMLGDYLVETDSSGNVAQPSPGPTTTGGYVPPTKGQEASYTTLRRGDSGTAVTNLVTELKLQGYYTGTITSVYTEEVEKAVKAFQKAKGLTVDGVAGSDTQHALFQTVPVGSGSNVDFTFYPAEKIDWFTGGINQQWAKGSTAKIYDVKTGIVWTARRWSGGNHAEVEPLTSADTARLCKSYGVSKSSDIPWNYRPVLVLVGEHNYCASIYAEEHTSTSDGVISNNNYKGTMCVWFTNSKTHGTGVVVQGHMDDINYAYQHAPGGQKK